MEPMRIGCYVLSIDNDDSCELHLFASDEEREAHMWDYAFENSGTEAETLEEFKESVEDIAEAMEMTNDGYLLEEMCWTITPASVNRV